MLSYLIKRIVLLLPTFFGIIVITFAMLHLVPGSPALLKAQSASETMQVQMSPEKIIEATEKLYGLDKPIHIQFVDWFKRAALLDFGNSLKYNVPVKDKLAQALPITLFINFISIFIIYLISVPIGVYSAIKPKGLLDRASSLFFLLLYSMPSFWVAMLLIRTFGGGEPFNWLPIAGFMSLNAEKLPTLSMLGNILWHLILPVVCLTYGGLAYLSRFVRATTLEVVKQDYVRTAKAKGLANFAIIRKHIFRNSLIPLLTLMASLLPAMIGGSVIIEQIFSIPGMGQLGFEAVLTRDYPMVMAIATISAFLTMFGILLADIGYAVFDPRVKLNKKI